MKRLVRIIGIITIAYLLVLSAIGTCIIARTQNGDARNYYLRDQPIVHLVVLVILVILISQLHRVIGQRITATTVRYALILAVCIYILCGLVFLFGTQLEPASDGQKVMLAAQQVLQGDTEAFDQTGYMYRYPFQRGLMLLDIVCILVFGDAAYLALQVLNLLALVVMLVCMVWFVDHIWQNAEISMLTILLHLLFLPIFLYITHNYGIMYGIALSMVAICSSYRACAEGRRGYYLVAAIAIALATEMKSNSLIWFVGIAIVVFISAMSVWRSDQQRALIGMVAIAGMFIAIKLASACTGTITEHLTGVPVSKGMPKMCWVYMGLMDDDDMPGSFNGRSTSVFEEADYDYDTANKNAVELTVQLFGYMATRPAQTVNQFARKITFEWNNPTFQGLNMQEDRGSAIDGYMERPLIRSFYYGSVHTLLTQYMNLFETVILAFALFSILASQTKSGGWEILLLTIYIGGFVFHFFWESKPQYTLPYFLLLIPYAAQGMYIAAGGIRRCLNRRIVISCIGMALVILALYVAPVRAIVLRSNAEDIAEYELMRNQMQEMVDR